MSNLPTGFWFMIGAVAAAIISGAIAVVQLVISKEDKLSEFRADWIRAITDDLARCLAEVEVLMKLVELELPACGTGLPPERLLAFRREHAEHYATLGETYHRLLLRLDSEEHQPVIDVLRTINTQFHGNCSNFEEVAQTRDRLIEVTRDLSHAVWERIRTGQPQFQLAKRLAIAAVVILSVVMGVTVAAVAYTVEDAPAAIAADD